MAKFPFSRPCFVTLWPRRILSLGAAIMVGALLGGAMINALLGHRLEELQMENEKLQIIIMEKENELIKLGSRLQIAYQAHTIQKIEIKLTMPKEHENLALDLEKQIKEILLPILIGKELDSVDPDLVGQILDQRQIKVDDKPFIIRVVSTRLAETSIFYLRVEEGNTPIPF